MEDSRTQAVYMKVYYQIIEEIINGGYPTGTMLPTQNEFAERFGVSRVTIREAIKELSHRGIVEAVKGRGTTVLHPPQELSGHDRQKGLTQNSGAGFEKAIVSRVVSIEVLPTEDKVANALRVPVRTLLTRIMRVRNSGGLPACLDDVYLLNKYVRDINFFEADLETGSLYTLLKNEANIVFDTVEERFRAVGCPRSVGTWLEIKPGEPVMQTQRLSFDEFGRAIEYCESYQRSDLYYSVIRSRGGLGGSISAVHHSKIAGCLLGACAGALAANGGTSAAQTVLESLCRMAGRRSKESETGLLSALPGADKLALMILVGLENPGDVSSACQQARELYRTAGEEAPAAATALAAATACAVKRNSTVEEICGAALNVAQPAGKTGITTQYLQEALHIAATMPRQEGLQKLARCLEGATAEDQTLALTFAALRTDSGSFAPLLEVAKTFAREAGSGPVELLAGALCGTMLGEEAIPKALRAKIPAHYNIAGLAEELAMCHYSGV